MKLDICTENYKVERAYKKISATYSSDGEILQNAKNPVV